MNTELNSQQTFFLGSSQTIFKIFCLVKLDYLCYWRLLSTVYSEVGGFYAICSMKTVSQNFLRWPLYLEIQCYCVLCILLFVIEGIISGTIVSAIINHGLSFMIDQDSDWEFMKHTNIQNVYFVTVYSLLFIDLFSAYVLLPGEKCWATLK